MNSIRALSSSVTEIRQELRDLQEMSVRRRVLTQTSMDFDAIRLSTIDVKDGKATIWENIAFVMLSLLQEEYCTVSILSGLQFTLCKLLNNLACAINAYSCILSNASYNCMVFTLISVMYM